VAIVVLVNLGLSAVLAVRPDRAWLAYPAMLLTLPVMVGVTTKRLHAIGRSGWFQAPVRAFAAYCIVMAAAYQRASSPAPLTLVVVVLNFVPALAPDLSLFLWLMIARTRRPPEPVAEVFD